VGRPLLKNASLGDGDFVSVQSIFPTITISVCCPNNMKEEFVVPSTSDAFYDLGGKHKRLDLSLFPCV
jgi:hypothetical protein